MFVQKLLYILALSSGTPTRASNSSIRASNPTDLEKRLVEYEKLNYCSDINPGLDSPLQKFGEELRKEIRTADGSCLGSLRKLLPIPTDCNSIIWLALPYRQLLLGSAQAGKSSNCKLLRSWEHLLPEALDRIHHAIDHVAGNHRSLKGIAKGVINQKNIVALLRRFRKEALANIANPTAEHVARMIIHQTIKNTKLQGLPGGFAEYVGAIHVFPDEFNEAVMQKNLASFISQQYLRLDIKQKIQFAVNEKWVSFLEYIPEWEAFCRKGSAQTALNQYFSEGETAPRMIAQVRRMIGDPLFKVLLPGKIPLNVCQDHRSYDACLGRLNDFARGYKGTHRGSRQSSAKEGGSMHTGCDLVRYDRIQELGKGSFGTVDLYHDMFTGTRVAVKRTLKSQVEKDPEAILLEEKIAKAAHHKHLSTIHCSFSADDGDRYWIMPFLSGGDMTKYVGESTEKEAAELAAQMLEGLIALLAAGYVHNDIKPENTMFDENKVLKIIDYGEGRPVSYEDVAEAVWNMERHGPGRDLLNVGITCLSLVFGQQDIMDFVLDNHKRDKLLQKASPEFKELILSMVDLDPINMATNVYLDWDEFKELPIFYGRNWDVKAEDIKRIQTSIKKALEKEELPPFLQVKDYI